MTWQFLLAAVLIGFGYYALREVAGDYWLTRLVITWLIVCTYLSMGFGLLWLGFRKLASQRPVHLDDEEEAA